jgi:hypothetical protein
MHRVMLTARREPFAMYETIERLTLISISRGVGFAALGVLCLMVGFAADFINVLRAGGIGTLLITVVLYFKAQNTSVENYKRTEVWIMLDPHERPPEDVAPRMVAQARRTILLRWTERSAWISAALLTGAVAAMISR